MPDHRGDIDSLVRAQLEADDALDPGDIVTHWVILVGLHGADEEGDAPSSTVIRSDQAMAIRTELGLMDERRMHIQAVMADSWRRYRDEED